MSSDSEGDLMVDVTSGSGPSSWPAGNTGDEVDESICPICNTSTYVGQTIGCDTCGYWFHFPCVGVKPGDDVVEKEDVPFYCTKCSPKKRKILPKKKPKKKKKLPTPSSSSQRTKPLSVSVKTPSSSQPASSPLSSPPIKLKISLGSAKSSSVSTPKTSLTSLLKRKTSLEPQGAGFSPDSRRKKRPKEVVVSAKDEEEQWLDAVEAGDVSRVVDPELKSIKDPKLMTARQRAMVERSKDEVNSGGSSPSVSLSGTNLDEAGIGHMALGYGFKKKTEVSEESLKIKAIKSQKRKEIEMEKRELDKQKTMDRLLKKKDSKVARQMKTANKLNRREFPTLSYKLTESGCFLSLPHNMEYPLISKPEEPKPKEKCSVPECSEPKKYNCSKTGKPLCSLKCYKQNIQILVSA